MTAKPQKKPVPAQKQIEYRDSIVYRDRAIEKIVQVERQLSWWQQTQIKGFWIAIIILVIYFRKGIFALIRRFI